MARTKRGRNKSRVRSKTSGKNVVSMDLDGMLKELDTQADDFQVDFQVGGDPESPDKVVQVDFSISKDLIPLKEKPAVSDSTVGRHLAKMGDLDFLNYRQLEAKRIIYPTMTNYAVMNSFREIRTRLLQRSESKNFVLMVASIDHEMGATFTAVNLGAAFSYEGGKTSLLIDCQSQKQSLGNLLDLEGRVGLIDYINDPEIDLKDIIYSTGVNRMRLIPFGSHNESGLEFLASERMKEFVAVLKRRHSDRFIIINAPPLEVSADAAILSEIADYVLIVVPYGRISNSRIKNAIKSLPAKKIAGVIINNSKLYA